MFCIKCGCRIPEKASKCPDCGADRPSMEYCGGYWSELNQNTQHTSRVSGGVEEIELNREMDVKKEGLKSNAAVMKTSEKGKRTEKPSLLRYAAIIEGAIILILLLYTVVSGASLRNQVSELEANSINSEDRYNELVREYEEISKKYNDISTKYKDLSTEYEKLKKESENIHDNTDSTEPGLSEHIESNTGTTTNEASVEEDTDKKRSINPGQTEEFPENDPMQDVFQEEKKDNF